MLKRLLGACDAGVTLMELVVSMTIMTILMTCATIFFVNADHSGYRAALTNQDAGNARVAMDSWTSMLRVAGWLDPSTQTDRFEEVTPTKIVFYANINNRASADLQTTPLTKVALMLRVTSPATGDGQLVQVIFGPDNSTPQSVRQVAVNASATGGSPLFQPFNQTGAPVDVANTYGCLQASTAVAGLCLNSPPAGAGLLDPEVRGSLQLAGGNLRGNPDPNLYVNQRLASIAGVTVAFTVSDPAHTAAVDMTSSASVNSGFAQQ